MDIAVNVEEQVQIEIDRRVATREAEIAKEQAKGPAADRGLIRDHQLAIEELRSAKRRKVFEAMYRGDLRKDDNDDIP